MTDHDRILKIIQQAAKKPVQPAGAESLFDSGILDSFALPDMVSALEQEFAISVPDSDLTPRKFESIDRIAAYIESRR
ncbi:MAG: acyl carrier protein [Bryobacteraceae bacterium]|nr:acyl carrier protein [Bryobacteraceae bacterium]